MYLKPDLFDLGSGKLKGLDNFLKVSDMRLLGDKAIALELYEAFCSQLKNNFSIEFDRYNNRTVVDLDVAAQSAEASRLTKEYIESLQKKAVELLTPICLSILLSSLLFLTIPLNKYPSPPQSFTYSIHTILSLL